MASSLKPIRFNKSKKNFVQKKALWKCKKYNKIEKTKIGANYII